MHVTMSDEMEKKLYVFYCLVRVLCDNHGVSFILLIDMSYLKSNVKHNAFENDIMIKQKYDNN